MAIFRSSTQAKRHRREASKKSMTSTYTMERTRSPLPPASPQAPLYSAIEDFRRGVLPSNEQLLHWIKTAQASPVLHPSPKLSAPGTVFIRDVQELLGLLHRAIVEKNADGTLQQFMHHARLAGRLAVEEIGRGPSGRLPVIDEPQRKVYLFGAKDANVEARQREMRREAGKNVRALYRLAQLALTSVDFREMVRNWQRIANRIMTEEEAPTQEPWSFEEETAEPAHVPERSKTVRIQEEPGMVDGREDIRVSPRVWQEGGSTSTFAYTTTPSPMPQQPMQTRNIDDTLMDLRNRVEHTEADLAKLRGTYEGGIGTPRPSTLGTSETYFSQFESTTGTIRTSSPLTPQSPATYMRRPSPAELKEQRHIPQPIIEKGPGVIPFYESSGSREELGQGFQGEAEEEAIVPELRRPEPMRVPKRSSQEDQDTQVLRDMIPMFKNLAGNEQFRKALSEAYAVLMRLQSSGGDISVTTDVAPELRYDANLVAAQRDLRHLLERFSSNQSLDPAIYALRTIQKEMAQDYALKDFVQDWQTFLERCIADAAYPGHEEYYSRGKYLLDRTRGYRKSKYGDNFRQVYQNLRDVIDGWQRDDLTRELGRVIRKIVQYDLFLAGGEPSQAAGKEGGQAQESQSPLMMFINALRRPEILSDLRGHFIPQMLKGLYELPIPRVESFSNGTHLVLEDMTIPADSFLPVDFDVQTVSRFRVNPRQKLLGKSSGTARLARLERAIAGTPGWQNSMRIRMAAIRTDLRDVRFRLEKATGWPKIRDEGLADLRFGGTGMTVLINVAASTGALLGGGRRSRGGKSTAKLTSPYSIVDPRLVSVRIDRLKLRLHATSRDWLYRLTGPIMAARLKRQIEKSVRDRIVDSIEMIDRTARFLTKGVVTQQ